MDNAEKGTAVPRLTYQAVGENDDICKAFAIRVVEAYGPLTENASAKKMKKYTGEKLASAVGVLLDNTQEVVVTGAAIGTVGAIGMGGAVLAGQSLPVLGTLLGGLSVAKWAVGGGVAGFIFGSGYTLITKVASAPFVAAKKIAAAAVGGEKKEEKSLILIHGRIAPTVGLSSLAPSARTFVASGASSDLEDGISGGCIREEREVTRGQRKSQGI